MSNVTSSEAGHHVPRSDRTFLPSGRMLVGTAAEYAVLFIAVFLVGGSGPDTTTAGAKIIADYHKSNAAVQISGYALVIAAAVLIFFGAALRRALRRGHDDWLADAAFGGTIAMAMAIVGFVVTAYAMHDAVKTGDATVAQSITTSSTTPTSYPPCSACAALSWPQACPA